jgi:hypothetical protein
LERLEAEVRSIKGELREFIKWLIGDPSRLCTILTPSKVD